MGLTVLVDDCVIGKLTALTDSPAFNFGLVIGQKSSEHIYVAHLAPLPSPVEDLEEGDDTADEKEAKKRQATASKPTSISTLVEAVIVIHAQQVVRMLPGGLDVYGVYVSAPSSELGVTATQGKLRSVLAAVHKATSRYHLGTAESSREKIVLFACTHTGKTGVKSLDLSEQGTQLVSGSLRAQPGAWTRLDYSYRISLGVFIPKEKSSQALDKTVMELLRPWAESLKDSLLLIGGEMLEEEDMLGGAEEKATPTRGKGKKAPPTREATKVIKVDILEEANPCGLADEKSGLSECAGSVVLRGTVAGKAFLQGKSCARDACSAVLCDLRRSVLARWEMHCDSLVEEEQGAGAGSILHEPPRRVFFKARDSQVTLCDYLFPGDAAADACHSAKELLDVEVAEGDVDETGETWADPKEFCSPVAASANFVEEMSNDCGTRLSSARCYTWPLGVALLVAGVGIAVAYFLIAVPGMR